MPKSAKPTIQEAYRSVYDKISDTCNDISSFVGEILLEYPDMDGKIRARYDLLLMSSEALRTRAHQLNEHLAWDKIDPSEMKIPKKSRKEIQATLAKRLEECNISRRSFNGLRAFDIITIADLVCLSKIDVMSLRNLGRKSIDEIQQLLVKNGLRFKMDVTKYGFIQKELKYTPYIHLRTLQNNS